MDESEEVPQKLASFRLLYLIAQMVGVTVLILMTSWIYLYLGGLGFSDPSIEFNWHPILMTIGMIYLYGNSESLISVFHTNIIYSA